MTTSDAAVAGVADELAARVRWLNDARSGPGSPPAVETADEPVVELVVELVVAGHLVEAGPAPLHVGRSAAMFGIDHPKVSRRHVGVQLVDGVLIATDLGSRNGTWLVRGDERSPLTAMAVLQPGDELVTLDDVELVRVPIRNIVGSVVSQPDVSQSDIKGGGAV